MFGEAPRSKSQASLVRRRNAHRSSRLPACSARIASWYGGGASKPQSPVPKKTSRLRSSTAAEDQTGPQPRF